MRGERFWVCLRCFARQVDLDACARCGARPLHDLRSAQGRAAVAEHIADAGQDRAARATQSSREAMAVTVGCLLGGAALLLQAALGLGGTLLSLTALGMAALIPLLVVWFGRSARVDDVALLRAVTPRLECVERVRAEVDGAPHAIQRVTGRVRVLRAVEAPVSGSRCAAVRVAGSAFGAVDDALCGAFEVLDAQGNIVARYEGDGLRAELPVGEATRIEAVSPGLRAFLEARMVYDEDGRALLAESVIADGDTVTLEGPADGAVVAEGYRESRAMWVFRGTGRWPVTLRPEPEARVRVALEAEAEAAEMERALDAIGASRRR